MSTEDPDASQTAAATDPQDAPAADSRLLDHLLAMADSYRGEHALRQAMEVYFLLVEAHCHTPQAGQACSRLVDIAEGYEDRGERHLARSIYERLLRNE